MRNNFQLALDQYKTAISFNQKDYYALSSAAQCKKKLDKKADAQEHFKSCLETIERSGDLRKKRERITRAGIAVIASNAARECNKTDSQEQYAQEARELLSGNLAVDGLSPKFFSPSTKRLIGATELLKELSA